MYCKDCEHFEIALEPIRDSYGLWDMGQAKCKKHNLVVEFADRKKLNKLQCYESQETRTS